MVRVAPRVGVHPGAGERRGSRAGGWVGDPSPPGCLASARVTDDRCKDSPFPGVYLGDGTDRDLGGRNDAVIREPDPARPSCRSSSCTTSASARWCGSRPLTGSKALAEDLVQDVFVRCTRGGPACRSPRAYLKRAVVNACRSAQRRQARERRALEVVVVGRARWRRTVRRVERLSPTANVRRSSCVSTRDCPTPRSRRRWAAGWTRWRRWCIAGSRNCGR